jgi:hypothetical protein
MSSPFQFTLPTWIHKPKLPEDPKETLKRSKDVASMYYSLATQTGIHAMIEWCGVMKEHISMLEAAYTEHGIEPNQIDQHSGVKVPAPEYQVAYMCEKLGCQLKPFIHADRDRWRTEINKWFDA